jgi:hypothetical protein
MGAFVTPAVAKTQKAEPPISTTAWYWKDQSKQEIKDPLGNTYTLEAPNPFCPSIPGSLGSPEPACAEGRLPVEIQDGNYDEPNKVSAVNFDLSLVPVGSDVKSFTVSFLEAKSGCYDTKDEDQDPNYCEETDPVNIDGKELRACLVTDFFGEGDAREYKEIPRFTCDGAPVAKRKEITAKDGTVTHRWDFDLTPYGVEWIKNFTTTTAILITGNPPKQAGGTQDTWRVVLAGPKLEDGVITSIVYEPSKTAIPPPTDDGGTTTTDPGTTGTDFSTGGTGDFSTGGTSIPTGTTGGTDTGTTAGDGSTPTQAGDAPPLVATEGADTTPQGIPGYVWLGIVVGLMAFSMVRTVVLDRAAGIRPNGVLAQIHSLNQDRNGDAAVAGAAAATSPLAPLGKGLRSIRDAGARVFGRFSRKKG